VVVALYVNRTFILNNEEIVEKYNNHIDSIFGRNIDELIDEGMLINYSTNKAESCEESMPLDALIALIRDSENGKDLNVALSRNYNVVLSHYSKYLQGEIAKRIKPGNDMYNNVYYYVRSKTIDDILSLMNLHNVWFIIKKNE
jgi:hypothetical protein